MDQSDDRAAPLCSTWPVLCTNLLHSDHAQDLVTILRVSSCEGERVTDSTTRRSVDIDSACCLSCSPTQVDRRHNRTCSAKNSVVVVAQLHPQWAHYE